MKPILSLSAPTALAIAGVSSAAPAFAQDYAARNVGGWTVAASKDGNGCFLTKTYGGDGETTLLLGLDVDGGNHLSVLNRNWSIQPQERLRLNFKLSNGGYSKQLSIGMASEGKKGFVTNFEAKFPAYFASSKALHIYRGTVPVEQLSLVGSGAAVAEVRRCVAAQRARGPMHAEDRARSSRIPKDPFAPERRSKR